MRGLGGVACLGAVLVLSLSCGEAQTRYRTVKGASGRDWKVLAQKPLTTRKDEKAIQFRYETDLDLSDVDALRAEVELFLADRQQMLDVASIQVVVVSANSPIKSGWAETRDEYRFRLVRDEGAGWSMIREVRSDDVSKATKVHVR